MGQETDGEAKGARGGPSKAYAGIHPVGGHVLLPMVLEEPIDEPPPDGEARILAAYHIVSHLSGTIENDTLAKAV